MSSRFVVRAADRTAHPSPRIPPIAFSRAILPRFRAAGSRESSSRLNKAPARASSDPGSSPRFAIRGWPLQFHPSQRALCRAKPSPPHPKAPTPPRVENIRSLPQTPPANTPPRRSRTTLEIRPRRAQSLAGTHLAPPLRARPDTVRRQTSPAMRRFADLARPPRPIFLARVCVRRARATASLVRSPSVMRHSQKSIAALAFVASKLPWRVIIPELALAARAPNYHPRLVFPLPFRL